TLRFRHFGVAAAELATAAMPEIATGQNSTPTARRDVDSWQGSAAPSGLARHSDEPRTQPRQEFESDYDR
ncbi:MAG: hypothetical protein AAFY64_10380, partial [Pseudomonadota bacterium]